jgi:hypothetical protein
MPPETDFDFDDQRDSTPYTQRRTTDLTGWDILVGLGRGLVAIAGICLLCYYLYVQARIADLKKNPPAPVYIPPARVN